MQAAQSKFQFRYGSIKSNNIGSAFTVPANFNSAMVRLKAIAYIMQAMPGSDFNSAMVRLKASASALALLFLSNFNSAMVRLKAPASPGFPCFNSNFNSAMVRLKVPGRKLLCSSMHISIPLWFD